MKKLGLVGGISWASTLDYYRLLNEGINQQLAGLNFAECIIYSVNFNHFQQFNADYDWDATFELLYNAAENLKKSGAEAIVLCANTAHIVADRIEKQIGLPLIHITTATANAVKRKGLKRIGLLGTSYTMELDFYKDKLIEGGLEPLIPERSEDRDYIEDILRNELSRGIINPETKKNYLKIIQELIDRGAEGIILGCTEIPLLIKQEDVTVPVFDTIQIHVDAAVAFAVSNQNSTVNS